MNRADRNFAAVALGAALAVSISGGAEAVSARKAHCDHVARDYANQQTAGNAVAGGVGGALLGAGVGALVGGGNGNAIGTGAAIGAGAGLVGGTANGSSQWNYAYEERFDACMQGN
jgi:uncharacterized protein YcfJ